MKYILPFHHIGAILKTVELFATLSEHVRITCSKKDIWFGAVDAQGTCCYSFVLPVVNSHTDMTMQMLTVPVRDLLTPLRSMSLLKKKQAFVLNICSNDGVTGLNLKNANNSNFDVFVAEIPIMVNHSEQTLDEVQNCIKDEECKDWLSIKISSQEMALNMLNHCLVSGILSVGVKVEEKTCLTMSSTCEVGSLNLSKPLVLKEPLSAAILPRKINIKYVRYLAMVMQSKKTIGLKIQQNGRNQVLQLRTPLTSKTDTALQQFTIIATFLEQ